MSPLESAFKIKVPADQRLICSNQLNMRHDNFIFVQKEIYEYFHDENYLFILCICVRLGLFEVQVSCFLIF